jgi:hypothetical protein
MQQLTVVDDKQESAVEESFGQLSGVVDPAIQFPEIREGAVLHPDDEVFVLHNHKKIK